MPVMQIAVRRANSGLEDAVMGIQFATFRGRISQAQSGPGPTLESRPRPAFAVAAGKISVL
jgi:hypothetical protein